MTPLNHDPDDEDRSVDSYCVNCGDPFDEAAENVAIRVVIAGWRPCPKPSPGTPLVHCGVGGHMYTDRRPRCS